MLSVLKLFVALLLLDTFNDSRDCLNLYSKCMFQDVQKTLSSRRKLHEKQSKLAWVPRRFGI